MQHSRYGGSRFAMIMACAGYLNGVINEDITPEIMDDDDAVGEGNAAHELSHISIRLGVDPADFVGMKFNDVEVTAVMAEYVRIYIDHVRERINAAIVPIQYVEQKFTISSIHPLMYGTPDFVLIDGDTLYISDLKYGFLVVDEVDNAQCIYYALAVLDTLNLWTHIKKVVCTIVQPRIDHMQGDVRPHNYTIHELRDLRQKFYNAFHASRDPNAVRTAGVHCRYCEIRDNCRPRLIRTIMKSSLDLPLNMVTDEEVNSLLKEIPTIKKHLEAMQERATVLARGGKVFKDYKLVRAKARAKCNDETKLKSVAAERGIKEIDLYNEPKLKGKTVLRKPLGKNPESGRHWVDELFDNPEITTKLVPLTHASTAVAHSVRGVFKPIEPLK